MAITNKTCISGYITKTGKPDIHTDYTAYRVWHDKNFKVYILSGNWKLESATNFARKRGLRLQIMGVWRK